MRAKTGGATSASQPAVLDSRELVRELRALDATLLLVGGIVGSGIFLTTGGIAAELPSPFLIMAVWVAGGLISLAGALSYAELGAAMPWAGGQYVYLREAYGGLAGFLFGWTSFFVIQSGTVATVAVGMAEYIGYFVAELSFDRRLPLLPISAGSAVAVAGIAAFTAVNYRGVKHGSIVQNIFTYLKVVAIVVLVLFGLAWGSGRPVDFSPKLASNGSLASAFGVALIAVLWAYDGWYYVCFAAGEIKRPERSVPVSLAAGTLIVMALYLAANYIYLYAVPVEEMRGVTRIAELAATKLFGTAGASFISAAIIVSCAGAINAAVLAGPRIYYAMARDGLFFNFAASVHPSYRTPHLSILAQGVWASVLAISGSYEQLFTYVMFPNMVFYAAAVGAVFVLRKKYPDLNRPYRTLAFPLLPLLYIAFACWFVANTLLERPSESGIGLLIVLAGVPAFFYWRGKSRGTGKELGARS